MMVFLFRDVFVRALDRYFFFFRNRKCHFFQIMIFIGRVYFTKKKKRIGKAGFIQKNVEWNIMR